VTATPIEIDGQESLKQVSFLTLPWDELVEACASTTSFAALAPSANDGEVKVRGMVCTPPLLLAEAEMNSTWMKPVELVIAFMAAISCATRPGTNCRQGLGSSSLRNKVLLGGS
jgi:hypothetical protein